MNTYIEITFSDGTTCTCVPEDVSDITEGSEGYYTTEEVQMTEQEFNALPEFQG